MPDSVCAHAASVRLRRAAVAAHVAVLATDRDEHQVLLTDAVVPAHGWRGSPHDSARTNLVLRPVAELEARSSLVDEVELFLLVVEVVRTAVPRRDDECVHAERGDAERLANLPEAGAVAEGVECGKRVALAGGHLRIHVLSDRVGGCDRSIRNTRGAWSRSQSSAR